MDMLLGDKIAEANLTDWRKLAQGLHARYVVDDFSTGARFIVAVGEAGDEAGDARLLFDTARALEPDPSTVTDGDHVATAEAVGRGALGVLDEVDGALVLAIGQERRRLGGDPGGLCVGHGCNLLG